MKKLLSTTLQISLIAFSLFFITSLVFPARALTLQEFISHSLTRQPDAPAAPAAPVQPAEAPAFPVVEGDPSSVEQVGVGSEKSSLSVRSTSEMPMSNPEESSPVLLKDTTVASGRPDLILGKLRDFWVGVDENFNPPYLLQQALLMFRIPEEVRGQTIGTAKLRLYLAVATYNDVPLRINVRRVSNDWDEDITWNTISSITVYPDYTQSSIPSTDDRWYEVDVKSLVKAWQLVPDSSNLISFMLSSDLEVSSPTRERGFYSKDYTDDPSLAPQLVIVADSQPTPTQPPMDLRVYAGEYVKMMSGKAFDPKIDINGDNVRDLRDYYDLRNLRKAVPTDTPAPLFTRLPNEKPPSWD